MNFLGHAFVATALGRTSPPYVLGAMLPDFMSMSRNRIAEVSPGELAEGVAHHHATDAVFHRHPDFRALERLALAELEAAGVRRGPSMAAAHIGTELQLDGWCLRQGHETQHYTAALEAPDVEPLRLRDEDGRPRLIGLLGRLRGYGLDGYQNAHVVTERIGRALQGRRRLAIQEDEVEAIERVLRAHDDRVSERAPAILSGVVSALR